jgi:uncharacterized protein YodC (DUF2158 family)
MIADEPIVGNKTEDDKIVVGDIVWLKSGSLPMTVRRVDDDGDVFTQWFALDGRCYNEVFKAGVLTKTRRSP